MVPTTSSSDHMTNHDVRASIGQRPLTSGAIPTGVEKALIVRISPNAVTLLRFCRGVSHNSFSASTSTSLSILLRNHLYNVI